MRAAAKNGAVAGAIGGGISAGARAMAAGGGGWWQGKEPPHPGPCRERTTFNIQKRAKQWESDRPC